MSLSVILSLIFLRISLRQILKLQVVDPEEGPFLIYFWTKAEALKAVHYENHKRAFFLIKSGSLSTFMSGSATGFAGLKIACSRLPVCRDRTKKQAELKKKQQNKTRQRNRATRGACSLPQSFLNFFLVPATISLILTNREPGRG